LSSLSNLKVAMFICSLWVVVSLHGCKDSVHNKDVQLRIALLEYKVAEVADKQAIHDVLNRYARALDWLDEKRLDRVFFDDAVIDFGFFKGTGEDFKPVVMDVERNLGRRWHQTTQASINLRGDFADVESYGIAFGSSDSVAVADSELGLYVGYYQDKFAKRDGEWGIIYRKYIMVSAIMMQEMLLDGDLSVMHKIGKASVNSPDYRDVGN